MDNVMDDSPQTLLEAARYFSDLAVCPNCGAKGDRIGEVAREIDGTDIHYAAYV